MTKEELFDLPIEQRREMLRWVWTWGTGKNVPIFEGDRIVRHVDLPPEFVKFVNDAKRKRNVEEARVPDARSRPPG